MLSYPHRALFIKTTHISEGVSGGSESFFPIINSHVLTINDVPDALEQFLTKKQKLDEASSTLTDEIAELGNKLEVIRTSEDPETEKLVGEMKKYSKESQLTSGMVQTFIESVEITDDQHAQIIWKFSDIFKRFMEEQ